MAITTCTPAFHLGSHTTRNLRICGIRPQQRAGEPHVWCVQMLAACERHERLTRLIFIGTYGLQFAIKALDYGLSRTPFRKISEIEPVDASSKDASAERVRKHGGQKGSRGHGDSIASDASKKAPQLGLRSLWSLIYDGAELVFSIRGIGWDYGTGTGLHVPQQWKNVNNRMVFILQAVMTLAFHTLVADFLCTILRLSRS